MTQRFDLAESLARGVEDPSSCTAQPWPRSKHRAAAGRDVQQPVPLRLVHRQIHRSFVALHSRHTGTAPPATVAATPPILIRLAASGKEPLVAMGSGGFGIPGRHFSTDVRPDGVDATAGILSQWNGSIYGIANNRLIAGWQTGGKNGGEKKAK